MRRKIIVIGVTGSFGTGKTTVAKIFKAMGARVLDADKMARKVLSKKAARIAKAFGMRILNRSKEIDRGKLARLVFGDKKSLDRLCRIIHPAVIDRIKRSVKKISASRGAFIVIDAPLLIEAGLHKITDHLIVVKTSRSTQIKRAINGTALSRREVLLRIKNQMPLSKKIKMADYIIDNNGTKTNTRKLVKKIWEDIKNGNK